MYSQNTKHKILIFIVSYNAEQHIEKVLTRIKHIIPELMGIDYEVLIIDDASKDNTVAVAEAYKAKSDMNITIFKNPINQGYGGNQKIGYQYAINFGFDSVVLLHGDNQYPPECIKPMLDKIILEDADMVLGSRMLRKKGALKGGMPLYKFAGNIVLTKTQNFILGTKLSEFHTGFKAYKTSFLKRIPFSYNSNDFDFDTDIIIQAALGGAKFGEVPIPTHYGDEICNVNGVKYALQVLRNSFFAKVQKYSIYYHPKYDFRLQERYESKVGFNSSHQFAIDNVSTNAKVLDIGDSNGYVAEALRRDKNCSVFGIDKNQSERAQQNFDKFIKLDVDKEEITTAINNIDWIDAVLLLDVLEHISEPEKLLRDIRTSLCTNNPKVIVTAGNVGFLTTRLSLFLGNFNYSKRGLLDLVKKRLFTFHSMKRMLKLQGYTIEQVSGIPIPFELIVKNKTLARMLSAANRLFIKISKSMFSYQMAIIARPKPDLGMLLEMAKKH